jgi:hydroxyacylglutathione hydrolase
MNLIALPAFTDNYIWILHDGRHAIAVDPGESAPVLAALDAHQLELAAILVTHQHNDHVAGINALRLRLHGPVYGPAHQNIPKPYVVMDEGDQLEVLGLRFEVMHLPGHTSDHIAYRQEAGSLAEPPILFSGDVLFSAGCGRMEGTPEQFHHSLMRLAALPGNTRVCCTHEYTLSNLSFAQAVEPDNSELTAYTTWCQEQRQHGRPTLPTTVARELTLNPFLRCTQAAVVQSALQHGANSDDPVAVFAALRQWKNHYT